MGAGMRRTNLRGAARAGDQAPMPQRGEGPDRAYSSASSSARMATPRAVRSGGAAVKHRRACWG